QGADLARTLREHFERLLEGARTEVRWRGRVAGRGRARGHRGGGGAADGGEDLRVAGATAEVARQSLANGFRIRRAVAVEEGLAGQDHARDADPALHSALLDERLLQRVQ